MVKQHEECPSKLTGLIAGVKEALSIYKDMLKMSSVTENTNSGDEKTRSSVSAENALHKSILTRLLELESDETFQVQSDVF